jgi:hypothetical protein
MAAAVIKSDSLQCLLVRYPRIEWRRVPIPDILCLALQVALLHNYKLVGHATEL